MVPGKYIHTPREMPDELQKEIGCVIGVNYPLPLVEHRFARERVIQIYRGTKQKSQHCC